MISPEGVVICIIPLGFVRGRHISSSESVGRSDARIGIEFRINEKIVAKVEHRIALQANDLEGSEFMWSPQNTDMWK